ncbi:conserved hypothetical protein [Ricinus communis]|uniref:Retrotransposon gag domain-containing protein n=1 Tax=Ricinus communis TaxID=3988 RepID=B9S3Q8_RICCO|nr:conserved hypothetical protein [Ricinus communis]
MFESRPAKLEFPIFQGDDPTVWNTRAEQYFDFQMTTESKKYLWRLIISKRAYKNEGKVVTWDALVEELWARFGRAKGENFDEALSKIRQTGSLRDYQRQFEQLGNRVHGWTQKALVGTFIGGLKPEIADAIRFFKPKTLKDAIDYARMKDQ